MEIKKKSAVLATGFAMFSMFFGAGNVVFPLAIGQETGHLNFYAISGLLISAVGIPLLGLISATLFNGNYKHYFERIGKVPGFLVALFIMGLIGPFGAMPRLFTVAHSTFAYYWTGIPFVFFSLVSCIIVFALTFKKNKIVDILGYYLTPILLFSLVVIIILGLIWARPPVVSILTPGQAFMGGLQTGYSTMDLLATFFFSSVVLSCLESTEIERGHKKDFRNVIFMTLKASIIGMGLLAMIYIGFSYVAAFHSSGLKGLRREQLLGAISVQMLGPYAGVIAIIAVSMACLTTAIALAAVFSEFLHNDITMGKLPYIPSLIITLVVAFLVSTLRFGGIAAFLEPILIISYPALIVLAILNIAHKLAHVNIVKTPVAVTFLISLGVYAYQTI